MDVDITGTEYFDHYDELQLAARFGSLHKVKRLAKKIDARDNDSLAICAAAVMGRADVVKFLIPHSDTKAGGSRALRRAVIQGYPNVVRELLPVSDIHEDLLIRAISEDFATREDQLELVRILIPHTDPKLWNSRALVVAIDNDLTEIVELLLPVSGHEDLRNIRDISADKEIVDLINSQIERNEIVAGLTNKISDAAPKKARRI